MIPKIKRKPASKAQNKIKIPQLNSIGKIPVWRASREISGVFGKLPSKTTHTQIATANKAGGPKTIIFAKIRLIMLFHYIQRFWSHWRSHSICRSHKGACPVVLLTALTTAALPYSQSFPPNSPVIPEGFQAGHGTEDAFRDGHFCISNL